MMVLMKNAQLEKMGLSCLRRLARACKTTHGIRFASHAAAFGPLLCAPWALMTSDFLSVHNILSH